MKTDIKIIIDEEAPLKIRPVITNPGWAGKVDLSKLSIEHLYSIILPLYDFTDIEVLIIWLHFFVGTDIRTIEKERDYTITKQRNLYAKYKEKVKKYQKTFKGGIYDDMSKA